MNTRLLRRIQKQILKEPRQFDMGTWFRASPSAPNCGTTACVAGWAIALSKKKNPLEAARIFNIQFHKCGEDWDNIDSQWSFQITKLAARALGITCGQASILFHRSRWPYKYVIGHNNALTKKTKARVASNRIDHFIKTKGKE